MKLCCQVHPKRDCSICKNTVCGDCMTYVHIGINSWSKADYFHNKKQTPLVCKECIEKGNLDKAVKKRKKDVKKSLTYSRLKGYVDFLQSKKRTNAELLRLIHEIRDSCRAYGSQTNANYAADVIEYLIKEHKLGK